MPAVGRGTKPKSLLEHLSEQAPKRPVNDIVSINRYLLSARLLLNQASAYRSVGNEEQLYVVLLRFASLVLETIPKHNDFRGSNPEYVALKQGLSDRHFPELERLKASLQLKGRPEPPTAHSRNRPADAVRLSVSNLPQLDWASSGAPAVTATAAAAGAPASAVGFDGGPGVQPAPAVPQVDDLLELMQGGRAAGPSAPAAVQQPGQSSGGSRAGPMGPSDPYALAAQAAASLAGTAAATAGLDIPQPKYSHSYGSSSGRHALFAPSTSFSGRSAAAAAAPAVAGMPLAELQPPSQSAGQSLAVALPRYPSLERGSQASAPLVTSAAAELTQLRLGSYPGEQPQQLLVHPSAGPSLGPQEVSVFTIPASTVGLPDTCSIPHGQPPPPPPPPQSPPPPASAPPAPSGGPKELAKRAQLRDVHISVSLMEEFLHYARSNTSRGIESCGILAGKLLAGDSTFAITTLIIPKQQGTTDTVQALNEEEIFEAQFQRELYPMGWIHTHPTQTCFLSSVDVHTQCGYQTMLDEAMAIVMAPTDPSKRCGIFRLSTPGGLGLVQKCPHRGFHTHPPTDTGQELYELCGHVYINERTRHEVLDLR